MEPLFDARAPGPAEAFGDPDDDSLAWVIEHLPDQLRSRCCHPDEPWVTPDPKAPVDHDHGHTDCLFMNLAADEIERLRALISAHGQEAD